MGYHDRNLVSESTVQKLKTIRTALPVILRHRGVPVDRGEVPDGWRLKCKRWPGDVLDVSSYELPFYHQSCSEDTFVTIEPTVGWTVTSGRSRAGQVLDKTVVETFDEAVETAIARMEAIGPGVDMQAALRHDIEQMAEAIDSVDE